MNEKQPPASREDHDAFCTTEGWTLVRGASGRPVKHHRTYELTLWNGRILRTRISRPVDRSQYAPSMWSHILREQLEVDSVAFWACVRDGLRPDRGEAKPAQPKKTMPLFLLRELQRLGIAESRILTLDAGEAAALRAELLAELPADE